MKTQYYTATSLDGFIDTEDDSLEWLFPLGDVNDTSYPCKRWTRSSRMSEASLRQRGERCRRSTPRGG